MAASLNAKQTQALELALNGHNIVVTGSAGTGKSTVVSAIVKELTLVGKKGYSLLERCCPLLSLFPCFTTMHRFTGIENGRLDPSEIGPWIFNSPKHADVVTRVRETDVLIIDECSMISYRTFTLISEVLAMKDPANMFGNMQIILVGDFKQLPPVKDVIYGDGGSYCFETAFFDKILPHHIVLTDIVRQFNHSLINTILEVYSGTVSEETIHFIKSLDRDIEWDIHLFARNEFVDDFNRQKMLNFPGQLFEFMSNDEGEDTRKRSKLTVSKTLWLKIGMPVILLRNLTDRLVNGLRGVIYDIDNDGPTVEFKEAGVTTKLEKCSFEVQID